MRLSQSRRASSLFAPYPNAQSILATVFLGALTACSRSGDHSHDHAESSAQAAMPEAVECENAGEGAGDAGSLGLTTSLPVFWSLDANIEDVASGQSEQSWQFSALSACYDLVPLDTLTPVPGLDDASPIADPLASLDRIAIIQPRALTPADNVALDAWVRAGGRALIALDPLLTGHYDAPLGDPVRPIDSMLYAIPPVVTRWGLEVVYSPPENGGVGAGEDEGDDEGGGEGADQIVLGRAVIPIDTGSKWRITDPDAARCALTGKEYLAQCKVGEGQVTLFGDAAVFEQRDLAGENLEAMMAVLRYAFASDQ